MADEDNKGSDTDNKGSDTNDSSSDDGRSSGDENVTLEDTVEVPADLTQDIMDDYQNR